MKYYVLKFNFFSFFFFVYSIAGSQTIAFDEVLPLYTMPELIEYFQGSYGSVAFGDVDGDNDKDLVISGWTTGSFRETSLYLNNGAGGYTKKTPTFFTDVSSGSVAFADVDNDNDLDILITGYDGSMSITQLWLNDGTGVFVKDNEVNLPPVHNSEVAFGDYDNDNDQDIFITGYNSTTTERVANLYQNDGNGVFTLVTGTPFLGVSIGSVDFADIDGDDDLDILVTGSDGQFVTRNLYRNNGSNNFTTLTGLPFKYVYRSDCAFSDIDNDNDLDLIITGNDVNGLISELYENDGSGNFSVITGTPFEGVERGSVAFSDVDNDNDEDLLLTGFNGVNSISKIFRNNGSGEFSEDNSANIEGVYVSSVAFEDVDNDNHPDILINGFNIDTERPITKLYSNNGFGNFSLVTLSPPFEGTGDEIELIDIDNDGDKDIVLAGNNSASQNFIQFYLNDGTGRYSMDFERRIPGVQGKMLLGDIDNDGDKDIFLTGFGRVSGSLQTVAWLYLNNGNGYFSIDPDTIFEPISSGSVAFSDFDSDNDLDLFVTGRSGGAPLIYVYENDGNGDFSLIFSDDTRAVYSSSALIFGDVNGDNKEDFIISGWNGDENRTTLFINSFGVSSSSFIEDDEFLSRYLGGSIKFQDLDNDNDLDLISGSTNGGASIFLNDGLGNFPDGDNTPFTGIYGTITSADLDNDTDVDLIIGNNIFTNNGSGIFSLLADTNINGITARSSVFSDIDSDNDQDLIISGRNNNSEGIVKLYRNSFITLSVNDFEPLVDDNILIYPNPVKDNVTIKLDNNLNFKYARLYNVMGQLIKTFKNNTLNLSNLNKGLYLIEVETNSGKATKKIIIQ